MIRLVKWVIYTHAVFGLSVTLAGLSCFLGVANAIETSISTPPDDPSGMRSEDMVMIGVLGLIGLAFIALGIIRFFTWVLFAKTGILGRALGRSAILITFRYCNQHWFRDWVVRKIYRDITGKKLKRIATIKKNCKSYEILFKTRSKKMRAANSNRKSRATKRAA